VIEHPETDRETYVFRLGTALPPSKRGVVILRSIEDAIVFPPERADYERHRYPLLGVEFFGPVPQLDLATPQAQDPYQGDGAKEAPEVARKSTRSARRRGTNP